MNPTIQDRLHEGIKFAMERHWKYQKGFQVVKVKPEYLFTISTADALVEGFDGHDSFELSIQLEKQTNSIALDSMRGAKRVPDFFKQNRERVKRKGKVDICVQSDSSKEIHLIELKGFEPSPSEIKKELNRLAEFLKLYNGRTSIKSCHVAYSTTKQKKTDDWMQKQVNEIKLTGDLKSFLKSEYHETGEDPEYGIHCYYSCSISITREGQDFNKSVNFPTKNL